MQPTLSYVPFPVLAQIWDAVLNSHRPISLDSCIVRYITSRTQGRLKWMSSRSNPCYSLLFYFVSCVNDPYVSTPYVSTPCALGGVSIHGVTRRCGCVWRMVWRGRRSRQSARRPTGRQEPLCIQSRSRSQGTRSATWPATQGRAQGRASVRSQWHEAAAEPRP